MAFTTLPDFEIVKKVAEEYFQAPFEIEKTKEGYSTYVYRVFTKDVVRYLRILPEDASFAVEAYVHGLLLSQGVIVPKVVSFEHKNPLVGLSVMITNEMPGECIQQKTSMDSLDTILYEAGKQLAKINQNKVDGCGFLDRMVWDRLKGEESSFSEFYLKGLPDFDKLTQSNLSTAEINAIRHYLTQEAPNVLETSDTRLMHGDFDTTHIFHIDGVYSGIIDFGEIKGSHRLHDLAHCCVSSIYPEGYDGFTDLLRGYHEIEPVTEEDVRKIRLLSLYLSSRWVCRHSGTQWQLYFEGKVREQLKLLQ